MEELVRVLIGIIWVIIGFWISFKRDWYKPNNYTSNGVNDWQIFVTAMNVIFMPVALLIAILRIFIISKWDEK